MVVPLDDSFRAAGEGIGVWFCGDEGGDYGVKIYRRITLVTLFCLVGAVGMFLYSSASMKGLFVEWESLGKPPGGARQVIAPGYVQTAMGDIYKYTYKQDCINDCWIKSESPPSDFENFQSWVNCFDPPNLDDYANSMAFCEPWGPGISLTAYAIDSNGFVYYWNHRLGEYDWPALTLSPFIGAIIGFLASLPFLLIAMFNDLLEWLQKGAQQKESAGKS